MRDDTDKLGLPKAALAYTNLTAKKLGNGDWSKKVDMWMDACAELTGQTDRKNGFAIKDVGEPTQGKKKAAAEALAVEVLRQMLG